MVNFVDFQRKSQSIETLNDFCDKNHQVFLHGEKSELVKDPNEICFECIDNKKKITKYTLKSSK